MALNIRKLFKMSRPNSRFFGATASGTSNYFANKQLAIPAFEMPKSGLKISPIGMGTYRMALADEHVEALRLALSSGCNLIDTSRNYMLGQSEALIGQVLYEMFNEGSLKREEVVVVTKAGYLQGPTLDMAMQRQISPEPFPDMVPISENHWHCISPPFLKDQVMRSLASLEIDTIDVMLLHNPEYIFQNMGTQAESEELFYKRVRDAFMALEALADQGLIQWYGVSSNTLPLSAQQQSGGRSAFAVSLDRLIQIANEISPSNRFAVVQYPFNIAEHEAATNKNCQGGKTTCAQLAKAHGLTRLGNRPLNAIIGNELKRYKSYNSLTMSEQDLATGVQTALNQCIHMEKNVPPANKDGSPFDEETRQLITNNLSWGQVITANFARLYDCDRWRATCDNVIRPRLMEGVSALSHRSNPWRDWVTSYRMAVSSLLERFTQMVEMRAAIEAQDISKAMESISPALSSSPTLSQKAVRVLGSSDAVDCVLAGMRTTKYVQDLLVDMKPKVDEREALEILQSDKTKFKLAD